MDWDYPEGVGCDSHQKASGLGRICSGIAGFRIVWNFARVGADFDGDADRQWLE